MSDYDKPLPVIGGPLHGMMASSTGEVMRACSTNMSAATLCSRDAMGYMPNRLDLIEYRRSEIGWSCGALSMNGWAWISETVRLGVPCKVLTLMLGFMLANALSPPAAMEDK